MVASKTVNEDVRKAGKFLMTSGKQKRYLIALAIGMAFTFPGAVKAHPAPPPPPAALEKLPARIRPPAHVSQHVTAKSTEPVNDPPSCVVSCNAPYNNCMKSCPPAPSWSNSCESNCSTKRLTCMVKSCGYGKNRSRSSPGFGTKQHHQTN